MNKWQIPDICDDHYDCRTCSKREEWLANRLQLAEAKLLELGQVWEDGCYAHDGRE